MTTAKTHRGTSIRIRDTERVKSEDGEDRAAPLRGQRHDASALDQTDPDRGVGTTATAAPGHLLHLYDG